MCALEPLNANTVYGVLFMESDMAYRLEQKVAIRDQLLHLQEKWLSQLMELFASPVSQYELFLVIKTNFDIPISRLQGSVIGVIIAT